VTVGNEARHEAFSTVMTHPRIRLAISACLLGKPVRFDGGHKRDPFLVESLGQFVDWVPVCPEVESGLDAPRESMRLVQADGRIRLLSNKTAQDHTARMDGYVRRRVEELADGELCGVVLKKDSPTCGLEPCLPPGGRWATSCGSTPRTSSRSWPTVRRLISGSVAWSRRGGPWRAPRSKIATRPNS
jgi:uncharacterized protein YbbK (DUF523 family)